MAEPLDTGDGRTGAIGIDWGTSGFRAYRLDTIGTVCEARSAAAGILTIDDGDFESALEALVGDWLDAAGNRPVVLSGMIGSRNGWIETPYITCPAGLDTLADAMVEVELARGRPVHLTPGVSTRDVGGFPDVMRGEEVQILGALAVAEIDPREEQILCLPGTHSKWARVGAGRILRFSTHMTGELFDVIRRHSILGRGIEHAAWDDGAFLAGVTRSGDPGGLLHHAFGVRAAGLFGELSPTRAGAFLSGLVIGAELRAVRPSLSPAEGTDRPILLIGEEDLVGLYRDALHHLGLASVRAHRQAAAYGHWLLAESLASPAPGSG